MPRSENQKLKILYICKILSEKTDEEHPMTVKELIKELEYLGISAERKSIYSDLELLNESGLLGTDTMRGRSPGHYASDRLFELPELKLLVDAVCSSKFISQAKSASLVKKLESLCSVHQAKQLERQVFIADRVKTANETVYYGVDALHRAIAEGKKVSFKYFKYDVNKRKEYQNGGKEYVASPFALSFSAENYYLIAFSHKRNEISHFRVDKMEKITVLDEKRLPPPEAFNTASYAAPFFSMFSGEIIPVKIRFDGSLADVVLDRFGTATPLRKAEDGSFTIDLKIAVSNAFLSWLAQFGSKAEILAPQSVREKMKRLTEDLAGLYNS